MPINNSRQHFTGTQQQQKQNSTCKITVKSIQAIVLFVTFLICLYLAQLPSMRTTTNSISQQSPQPQLQQNFRQNENNKKEQFRWASSSSSSSLSSFIKENLLRPTFNGRAPLIFGAWKATSCLFNSTMNCEAVNSEKHRHGGEIAEFSHLRRNPVNSTTITSCCLFADRGTWETPLAPDALDQLSSHRDPELMKSIFGDNYGDDEDEGIAKTAAQVGKTRIGQQKIESFFAKIGKSFFKKGDIPAGQAQMMVMLGLSRLKKVPMKIKIRQNDEQTNKLKNSTNNTTKQMTQNIVRVYLPGNSFMRALVSSLAAIFRNLPRYFDRGSHTVIRYYVTNFGDYYSIAHENPGDDDKVNPFFSDFLEVDREDEVVFFEINYRFIPGVAGPYGVTTTTATTNNADEIESKLFRTVFFPAADPMDPSVRYGGNYSSIFSRAFRMYNTQSEPASTLQSYGRFVLMKHMSLMNCDADCYVAALSTPLPQRYSLGMYNSSKYESLFRDSLYQLRDTLNEIHESRNNNSNTIDNNNRSLIVIPQWIQNHFPESPPHQKMHHHRPRHVWISQPRYFTKQSEKLYRTEDATYHTQCISIHHFPGEVLALLGGILHGGVDDDELQVERASILSQHQQEEQILLRGNASNEDFLLMNKISLKRRDAAIEALLKNNGVCEDRFSRMSWFKFSLGAFLSRY